MPDIDEARSHVVLPLPEGGGVSAWAQVYALARQFGCEDDILVLRSEHHRPDVGMDASNTMNPFTALG